MSKSLGTSKTTDSFILAVVFIVFAAAFYFFAPERENQEKIVSLKKGQSAVLNFDERETFEMRWQLNKSKSRGLQHVEIHFIGWMTDAEQKEEASVFGAMRTARYEVRGLSSGKSSLTFEYKKRGASDTANFAKVQTHNIMVD